MPREQPLTDQYKQEALELWRASGRSAAKVAAELGIRPSLPPSIDPRLKHYLDRKSYDKALEYLEGTSA